VAGKPVHADGAATVAPGRVAAGPRGTPSRFWRLLQALTGFLGGLLALGPARAVDLPQDEAEAMFHLYDGGGVKAMGPALLVRKSIADKVSLSGQYYLDAVSNASIDVVTTASPYKERRTELGVGADYAYRDSLMTLSLSNSSEPDYKANTASFDVSQEVYGGMSTVSLGFTRGSDKVGRYDSGYFDTATHWRYRLGLTQILTPKWVASANFEAVSDSGYLGSPYRAARVFGAIVPERVPRTRSSRALKFRVIGDVGSGNALRAEYRYFWDNWEIKAHTLEVGGSHYFGPLWLADAYLRYYTQSRALFYSDNAPAETTYITRNRQLSAFNDAALGAKLSYTWKQVPGQYELKLNGVAEVMQFKFNEYTDLRTGQPYSHNATLLQLFISATY
jgi:hypothetical protein